MELSIRSLTDQVKNLASQRAVTPYHQQSHRSSPAPIPVHLRQPQPAPTHGQIEKLASIGAWHQMSTGLKPEVPAPQAHNNVPQSYQPHPPAPMSMPPQSQYSTPQQIPVHSVAAPLPNVPMPQYRHDTPEDWEKVFLQALSNADIRALRETLAHCPADKVMPLNGPLLVGQTIILSVIHKVCTSFSLRRQVAKLSVSSLAVSLTSRRWRSQSRCSGGCPVHRKSWMLM